MAKLKLSGAAVLLIIVVPVFMYAGALLIGIQLGRALERRPHSVSVRGALAYVAKKFWDTNDVFPASLVRDESSDDTDRYSKKQHLYIPFKRAEGQDYDSNSRSSATKAPPQARRFHVDADGRVHADTEDVHFVIEKPRHRGTPSADDADMVEKLTTPRKAKRYHSNHTSPRGVISVGPWGGSGGHPFYMRGSSAPRLRSIVLQHSVSGIHSLACDYSLAAAGDGDEAPIIRTAGPWGRPHNFDSTILFRATIKLSAGEHLTAVEGTTGHFSSNISGVVLTSLAFRTGTGKTYGPYGGNTTAAGTPFSVAAADDTCIVGFWGRSGWLLDAIGVYIKPSCSSSS